MKNLFFVIALLSFSSAIAQTLTGAKTGGSYKLIFSKNPNLKSDEVPYGDLDVDKLLMNELDFNLSYNSGVPGYHTANISGVATSSNGKIYMFSGKTGAESCKLQFTVKNASTISIKVLSGKNDCNFEPDSNLEGTYVRYAN